jgi:hypothetical protein
MRMRDPFGIPPRRTRLKTCGLVSNDRYDRVLMLSRETQLPGQSHWESTDFPQTNRADFVNLLPICTIP